MKPAITIGLLLIVVLVWVYGDKARLAQIADLEVEIAFLRKLPSIMDIQERIGAKPDGILGRETQEKWDRIVFDRYAQKYHDPNFYAKGLKK